jgi:hypothetical protein
VRGLLEEIVHGLGAPPKLAEDKTLYRGEGVKKPGERALIRAGDVGVVLGVELTHGRLVLGVDEVGAILHWRGHRVGLGPEHALPGVVRLDEPHHLEVVEVVTPSEEEP